MREAREKPSKCRRELTSNLLTYYTKSSRIQSWVTLTRAECYSGLLILWPSFTFIKCVPCGKIIYC